jgi:hypothetical protein
VCVCVCVRACACTVGTAVDYVFALDRRHFRTVIEGKLRARPKIYLLMRLANVLIHAFERGSVSICQAVLIWGGTPRPAQGGCLRWCRRTDRSFRVAVCDFHENSIEHTCLVALVSGDTLRMPASGGLLPRIRWALASWGAWAPRQAAVLVRCLCSQAACFSTCQHW